MLVYDFWQGLDVVTLAELYNKELSIDRGRKLPTRTVMREPWPSDSCLTRRN